MTCPPKWCVRSSRPIACLDHMQRQIRCGVCQCLNLGHVRCFGPRPHAVKQVHRPCARLQCRRPAQKRCDPDAASDPNFAALARILKTAKRTLNAHLLADLEPATQCCGEITSCFDSHPQRTATADPGKAERMRFCLARVRKLHNAKLAGTRPQA